MLRILKLGDHRKSSIQVLLQAFGTRVCHPKNDVPQQLMKASHLKYTPRLGACANRCDKRNEKEWMKAELLGSSADSVVQLYEREVTKRC